MSLARHMPFLPTYSDDTCSIGCLLVEFEDNLFLNWKARRNYPLVVRRDRIHPSLEACGHGIVDLEGVGLQRIRDIESAGRHLSQIEKLARYDVEWPIREWVEKSLAAELEVHAVKDLGSGLSVGCICFKRDVLCDYDDETISIEVVYDLSAIYVAADYSGMGYATGLFHAFLSDIQMTIEYVKCTCRDLQKASELEVKVAFALTGEAHSSGGAACGARLHEAMQRAVAASFSTARFRSYLADIPVIDNFQYGDVSDWKDMRVDEIAKAA